MKRLVLTGPLSKQAAIRYVNDAPEGYVLTLSEPKKSRDQEAMYHAIIGEIAESYLFCGRYWDAEDMKRLLIDQFRRDTAHDEELKPLWAEVVKVDLAPSLDGSGVVALGVQSRRFPKKLASAFIEWLHAWMAENLQEAA